MKEAFIKNRINPEGRARIDTVNAVITDYQAQGMQLSTWSYGAKRTP